MMHPAAHYTVPLSRKEVNALSVLARAGNIKARDKMVLSHYRFLVTCAGRYVGRGIPVEDLIAEGMVGLIRATETFTVARGVAFSSYAVWWITHSITSLIHEQSLSVRVPANFFLKGKGVNQTYKPKKPMTDDERKERNRLRIERNEGIIRAIRGSSSLRLDGDYGNALISPEPGPDQSTQERLNKKRVAQLLSVLPARDQEILRRRFGIDQADPESLQPIGDSMGFSKEYTRIRQNLALKELKYRFKTGDE